LLQLVNGRYLCNWCGADLGLPFTDRETIEIVSEHEGGHVRIIVVGGEEHHRCERPA
jgi:hypothetical protein